MSSEGVFLDGPEAEQARRFTRRHLWAIASDASMMAGTTSAAPTSTYRLVWTSSAGRHRECSTTNDNIIKAKGPCDNGLVCVPNPTENGREWCDLPPTQ
jgi:hypothetical protein